MGNVELISNRPDGIVHLKMHGDLTGALACRTRSKLQEINIYKSKKILLDFNGINYINPIGLMVLVQKLSDLRIKNKIEVVGLGHSYEAFFT